MCVFVPLYFFLFIHTSMCAIAGTHMKSARTLRSAQENINRNYEGAIQSLATACRLRPNDHTVWNKLGVFVSDKNQVFFDFKKHEISVDLHVMTFVC